MQVCIFQVFHCIFTVCALEGRKTQICVEDDTQPS